MRPELVKIYLKDNYFWYYNFIETHYPNLIKDDIYALVGYNYCKEIKKYIKKLLKNT